jgi:transcriptional regulator GlxA family with amidase domain
MFAGKNSVALELETDGYGIHLCAQVPNPDIVVVPGGMGTDALMGDKTILQWLCKVHETSLYTTSVCSGSLLLGAAGLLNGLEATTHWNALEFLTNFGAKPVKARVVRQGKIITAAGVSAGIDMALQLVALISDETTAKTVQLSMEYDPQPPYDCGSPEKAGPEIVSKAQLHMQAEMQQFAAELSK